MRVSWARCLGVRIRGVVGVCVFNEGESLVVSRREREGRGEEGFRGGGRRGPRERCAEQARCEAWTQWPWELPLEVGEGNARGSNLTALFAPVVLIVTLFFVSVIMDKYQEQPHLLDPHLGKSNS